MWTSRGTSPRASRWSERVSVLSFVTWVERLTAPFRHLLYRLYESHLLSQVRRGELPRHVGLILDGNRRYARQQGLRNLLQGHERGAEKVEEVLGWCEDLQIRTVTIWILSTENLSRNP